MIRIENNSDGKTTIIRLIGRMQSEHLAELSKQLERTHFVLDLDEVTLVDVAVVRFLNVCERQGIELLHCPRYVREWMRRECSEDDRTELAVIH
jgi:glutathione S-transferase